MSKKLSLLLVMILVFPNLVACVQEKIVEQGDQEPIETPEKEAAEPNHQEKETDGDIKKNEKPNEKPSDTLYLSVYMTKQDVIELIGSDYTLTTEEEPGGMAYYSVLAYDGITFYYTHQEEKLPDDSFADLIEITSNKYSYEFDLNIGGSVLENIDSCEETFENTFDINSSQEIFNLFNYIETRSGTEAKNTGYILRLDYDTEEYYESEEEIPEDLELEKVSLFIPLN